MRTVRRKDMARKVRDRYNHVQRNRVREKYAQGEDCAQGDSDLTDEQN